MQKFEQRTIFDFLDQEKQNNRNYKIINDSMLNLDEHIEKESIDAIITDPPYELNFMNKSWDNTGIAFQKETWVKCFNALKQGGYLLAFGGSRTYHRICCAIEDAGFEIRDCIMWLYGSGFPKSMNIGLAIDKKNGVDNRTGNVVKGVGSNNTNSMKNGLSKSQEFASEYEERIAQNEWQGWGTCLKPAFEPIIVARKPFKGSLVDNVLEYGVGGLNIDECRVENTKADTYDLEKRQISKATGSDNDGHFLDQLHNQDAKHGVTEQGRFPANLILTYDETDFDEVCGGFPNEKGNSASRYFYCAKASKKDRDEGLDSFNQEKVNDGRNKLIDNPFQRGETPRKNIHPTVKPTSLMQYLVRLVAPKGATILDVFMGSGSTGKAVMYENKERDANYNFIGFELNEEYCNIAKSRIEYVQNKK